MSLNNKAPTGSNTRDLSKLVEDKHCKKENIRELLQGKAKDGVASNNNIVLEKDKKEGTSSNQ